MFSLDYLIKNDTRQRISNTNIDEFKKSGLLIEGQIKIIFNKRTLGFIDKDIDYSGELLFSWFDLLFNVVECIYVQKYIAFSIIGGSKWLEFIIEHNNIIISKHEVKKKMGFNDIVSYTPLENTEVDWVESIDKKIFVNEVIMKTKLFYEDILVVNSLISNVSSIKKLKFRLDKFL